MTNCSAALALSVGAVAPIAASRESAAVPLRRLILSSHSVVVAATRLQFFIAQATARSLSPSSVTESLACWWPLGIVVRNSQHCNRTARRRGGATVGGNAGRASATAQASPIRRPRALSQIPAPTIAPGVRGTPRLFVAAHHSGHRGGRAPADMTVTRLTRNLPLP